MKKSCDGLSGEFQVKVLNILGICKEPLQKH